MKEVKESEKAPNDILKSQLLTESVVRSGWTISDSYRTQDVGESIAGSVMRLQSRG
jgi:hypothetical protein